MKIIELLPLKLHPVTLSAGRDIAKAKHVHPISNFQVGFLLLQSPTMTVCTTQYLTQQADFLAQN